MIHTTHVFGTFTPEGLSLLKEDGRLVSLGNKSRVLSESGWQAFKQDTNIKAALTTVKALNSSKVYGPLVILEATNEDGILTLHNS